MLDFVVFSTILALVFAAVFYLYQKSRRSTAIPSLKSSDSTQGNIREIKLCGGIHSFLTDLHKKLGPIAGFWFGKHFVVSLASPELFKEELKIFDRPPILFNCLEPLIGPSSIQFANGEDGKQRRKCYDRYFSHLACKSYTNNQFLKIGQNLAETWTNLAPNVPIPLHQHMMTLALKSILASAFGFEMGEKNYIQFHNLYDFVWSQLSSKMIGNELNIENALDKLTAEKIEEIYSIIRTIIATREIDNSQEQTFLDFLLNEDITEERRLSDCITYVVGGFHTTGNLLTWAIYYIALHEEIQENVYREIIAIFGKDAITEEKLCELTYTRQVIDETIRCSVLAPYAARYRDCDAKIGGYIIPKGTPVLHALGVVLNDQNIWSSPEEFNPTRFENDALKKLHPLSFKPFGFAAGRVCPGQKFAYCEVTTYLSILLKRFKVTLVEGQEVIPVRSLVSRPKEEIFIQISQRNDMK